MKKEKKIKRFTVEVNSELYKKLNLLCVDEEKSKKEIFTEALELLFEEKKKSKENEEFATRYEITP